MTRLLLLGPGYVARRFAAAARSRGLTVAGTARDDERAGLLEAEGIAAVGLATSTPDTLEVELGRSTLWLLSAPPSPDDPFLARLAALPDDVAPTWAGYLSTTGVYGDTGGAFVDEHTAPAPDQPRTRRRLEVERAWQELAAQRGWPLHVFRLGGIYGPGRSALDRVRAGEARLLVKPGKVMNRVHVDDIVQVLLASVARPRPGAVYNVVDGRPLAPEVVTRRAFELLGREAPAEEPFEEGSVSPTLASFYAGNVRVRSVLLLPELGVELRHQDALAGLDAVHQEESGKPM